MSQLKKIKSIFSNTHEPQYEKLVEADLLLILVNIAESLAIIADHIEKEDVEKIKIMIDGKEIKNDVQV